MNKPGKLSMLLTDGRKWLRPILILAALTLMISSAQAQTTQFTYQGKLNDNGSAANGNYDLQFKLFDTASVGTGVQQGSTVVLTNVTVTGGIFTVQLDFGAGPFPGANRFLEIGVKPTSGATFTVLGPRQPVTSTPYAIRSASANNANQLGGVVASQYVLTSDTRLTNARPPTAGSTNYIQNSTSQQAASNFNITGNGTVGGTLSGNIVNGVTQYNLNGKRVIGVTGGSGYPEINTFVGIGAGASNTVSNTGGGYNSFFGSRAGEANTTGSANSFFGSLAGLNTAINCCNSFFGSSAGEKNTTGFRNSFFGNWAGRNNTTGSVNAFFGDGAGVNNTTGNSNAFFGFRTGNGNTTGSNNSVFGNDAGYSTTGGNYNSFFGSQAGQNNQTGSGNAFFGASAGGITTGDNNAFFGRAAGIDLHSGNSNTFIGYGAGALFNGNNNTALGAETDVDQGLNNATAIGTKARVTQSNSLVLGAINGINNATADTQVGIGTTAPQQKLHLAGPDARLRIQSTLGQAYTEIQYYTNARNWNTGVGGPFVTSPVQNKYYIYDGTAGQFRMAIDTNGNVGIGTSSPDQTLSVNGGASKPGGGSWSAFSDLRLKNIKGRFTPGLNALMQLQPLRYEYRRDNALNLKSDGEHVGFSAQSVQRVIPEAVTKNDKGYLLVNNDPILWTMLNAIKEQQAQIQQQQKQIDGLKRLACRAHRRAAVCK